MKVQQLHFKQILVCRSDTGLLHWDYLMKSYISAYQILVLIPLFKLLGTICMMKDILHWSDIFAILDLRWLKTRTYVTQRIGDIICFT